MRFVNQYYIKRGLLLCLSKLSSSCFIGLVAFKAVANLLGEAVICADEKDRVKYSQIWFHFVQLDIVVPATPSSSVRRGWGGGGGGCAPVPFTGFLWLLLSTTRKYVILRNVLLRPDPEVLLE